MFFAGLVSKPLKTAENLVVRMEKRAALSPDIIFDRYRSQQYTAQPSAAVETIIITVIVI